MRAPVNRLRQIDIFLENDDNCNFSSFLFILVPERVEEDDKFASFFLIYLTIILPSQCYEISRANKRQSIPLP